VIDERHAIRNGDNKRLYFSIRDERSIVRARPNRMENDHRAIRSKFVQTDCSTRNDPFLLPSAIFSNEFGKRSLPNLPGRCSERPELRKVEWLTFHSLGQSRIAHPFTESRVSGRSEIVIRGERGLISEVDRREATHCFLRAQSSAKQEKDFRTILCFSYCASRSPSVLRRSVIGGRRSKDCIRGDRRTLNFLIHPLEPIVTNDKPKGLPSRPSTIDDWILVLFFWRFRMDSLSWSAGTSP
jgi:hypothetical protein